MALLSPPHGRWSCLTRAEHPKSRCSQALLDSSQGLLAAGCLALFVAGEAKTEWSPAIANAAVRRESITQRKVYAFKAVPLPVPQSRTVGEHCVKDITFKSK